MEKSSRKLDMISLIIFMIMLGALTFLSSCHESEIVKVPPVENGKPDVIDNPDTLVHKPDTVVISPDTIIANPDASKKTMKITWSELDYKLYTFNEKKQLEKYHFQYVFVQNDPSQIKSFDYQFTYDEQGKVIESLYNEHFKTVFEYTNGVLSGAKEYNGYNEVSAEYQFTLDNNGRLTEMIKSFTGGYKQMKYTYKYNQGNLVEMKEYYFEGDRYFASSTFEWANFDNHSYMENYTAFSPYVPTLKFWSNNPGKRTVKDKNGNITGAIETFSHTYDTKGNVASKSTQVILDKIYPSTIQYYTYQNF